MRLLRAVFLFSLAAHALAAPAATRTLIYEGRLDDRGLPASGRYDVRITPFAQAQDGASLVPPMTFADVAVREGRFRIEFELPGDAAEKTWLELGVRDAGSGAAFAAIEGRTLAVAAGPIGACWSTTGDSASNPAVNFLGTTDAQPLVLRVQNQQVARYEPSAVLFNALPNTANVIAGSAANLASAGVRGATVSGGGTPAGLSDPDFFTEGPNLATDAYGTVAGGIDNRAGNAAGTAIDTAFASVGGGASNVASGANSTIAGGFENTASGVSSVVGGGEDNQATAFVSTVAGGEDNHAAGPASFIGGGEGNCAGGYQSWAGGYFAKVRPGAEPPGSPPCADLTYPGGQGDAGTFIWADQTSAIGFISNGPQRFLARASGGFVLQAAIGSESVARAPRGYFNVVSGASGLGQPASPLANTVATLEDDGDTFLRLITPTANERGIIFGDAADISDGGVVYLANNTMQFRVNGNVVRLTIGSDGVVDLTALGAAGATSLCRNGNGEIASCSSSARYKDEVETLDLGLDVVRRLRPVAFRWKDSGAADLGFVAEEVAGIDPRLVTRNEAGEIEGVKYDRLSAVLAGALQEVLQREQLREQELATRDATQAHALAGLQAQLASLQHDMALMRLRMDAQGPLVQAQASLTQVGAER